MCGLCVPFLRDPSRIYSLFISGSPSLHFLELAKGAPSVLHSKAKAQMVTLYFLKSELLKSESSEMATTFWYIAATSASPITMS